MSLVFSFSCSGGGNSSGDTATTYSISGTVSGAVLQGVTITLTGTSSASTTTDASGNYSFSSVANGSYTITPSMTGYTFSPANISATINGVNITGQNFTATALATGYDYTTTVTPIMSQDVNASSGAVIEVTNANSFLSGLKLTIPTSALSENTKITIGEVNNPPKLPSGLNFVGAPVDFGPDGTVFSSPVTVVIPYYDEELSDAGVSDDTALKLYYFDKSTGQWLQATIISIDTVNNKITAQITHFSYYAKIGQSGTPPFDLGIPQRGDLLFKTGSFISNNPSDAWLPGHVGIYVGEKIDENGEPYNVIEALPDKGVTRNYYNPISEFGGNDVYMGAREPADFTLTAQQRDDIVIYAEERVGLPYAIEQTYGVAFGMLSGAKVKGVYSSFNCVGIAEAAYEHAGANYGVGLTTDWQENVGYKIAGFNFAVLTPAEMYKETKPAGGIKALPKIEWANITPNSGTECTPVILQVSMSHTYGLSFISSVTYITDDGYTNPNIYINDEGLNGDVTAGDGIYSAESNAGGNASFGQQGMNVTITDKAGKSDTIRLVYTFTGTCR